MKTSSRRLIVVLSVISAVSTPVLAQQNPSPGWERKVQGPTNFWSLSGNAGTSPGAHFLGTTDNAALEVKVNAQRALRLEPQERGNINILGGSSLNYLAPGVEGSVIAGGGGILLCDRYDLEDEVDCDHVLSAPYPNQMYGNFSTLAGGAGNRIEGSFNFIGTGRNNTIQSAPLVDSRSSAILTGFANSMSNTFYSSILGGGKNRMGGYAGVSHSVIAGGQYNHMPYGDNSIIVGGYGNYLLGQASTIGGGGGNSVEENNNTISGGGLNTIGNGNYATIPGGYLNVCRGSYSFVAGVMGTAFHNGTFLWSDASEVGLSDRRFTSERHNEFAVRATGGVRFVTDRNNATGVTLSEGGGSWASLSDRNAKENFEPVNPREVLKKVAELPLQTWNYKSQKPAVRHLGPTSQDFSAAFGIGDDPRHITNVDADGVSLAAIQGLNQILAEKDTEIQQLKKSVAALEEQLSNIAAKIAASR